MSFDEGHVTNFGLRAMRVRGIDVWVHWVLVIIAVIQLISNYLRQIEDPFLTWLAYVVAMVVSLLIHEFGHCYAAFRVGGSANRVLLWPLGGLAYCDAPRVPRAQFIVAAGGPVASAALGAAAIAACAILGWELLPFAAGEEFFLLRVIVQYFVLWDVFLLAINLIPCWPLDGGRMLHAVLWARSESHGHAMGVIRRVSRVAAVFALVSGLLIVIPGFGDRDLEARRPLLFQFGWGCVCVAALHFLAARALEEEMQQGEEDGIFGYDFSRGYTSLERTATRRPRGPSFLARIRGRRRERALAQKREEERRVRERLDQLLAKIHRDGMASLSREEQRFLEKASRTLKK
jgi:Zn-dependent protease